MIESLSDQILKAIDAGHSEEELISLLRLFNESYGELIPILYEGNLQFNRRFKHDAFPVEPINTLYDYWLDRAADNNEF